MQKFLTRHAHILSIVCPILIGLIYVILCCLNINSAIWYDESYTHYITRGDYGEILNMTALDVHPPLYYFAVKTWSLIFGNSVVAMRFMSVFFGLLAILVLFHLIKHHFKIGPAIVATLAFAVSPMFIRYGTEMRMYTMVLALVLLATLLLNKALETESAALELKTKTELARNLTKKARVYWALYAVVICLGMWTQYFTALAWIAHVFYILYYFGVFKKGGLKSFLSHKPLIVNLILTYLLAVALYLPWLPTFLAQFRDVQNGFWIPEVTALTPVDLVTNTLIFCDVEYVKDVILLLVLAGISAIVYFSVKTFRAADAPTKKHLSQWLILMIVPPILLMLLSFPPLRPTFVNRYILYSISAAWVLIGLVLAMTKHKKTLKYFVLVACTIAFACTGVVNFTTRQQDSTVRDSLETVISLSNSGEPVLVTADYNFYDAVAYTNDEHPIYFIEAWSSFQYGAYEPIRNYHFNTFAATEDFLKTEPEKFWVFADAGSDLKEEFRDFEVLYTVEDKYHTAWELQKK